MSSCSGCTWHESGKTHQLVLGIGVITTENHPSKVNPPKHADVSVEYLSAFGAFISSASPLQGIVIGQFQHQSVEVDRDADVIVDAQRTTKGETKVIIKSISE